MNISDLQRIGQLLFPGIAVAVFLALQGCTAAMMSFERGLEMERQGQFEEAVVQYAKALQDDPEYAPYRLRLATVRVSAAEARAKKGDEKFAAGNYSAAIEEYQAATLLNPGMRRYEERAAQAARLLQARAAWQEGLAYEQDRKFKEAAGLFARALERDPGNPQYTAAVERVAKMKKQPLRRYELQLNSNKFFTLKLRETRLKDVFAVLSQLSGINFVFDEGVKDVVISVNLNNATFEQTFALVTGMNRLAHKVLNEGTIIIYPRTPEKLKQYEELVVRTYQLRYLDAKKALTLIRSLLQVRKLQLNEDNNALVLRDTLEMSEVVEKILDANDLPDPEVILDVEVLEVNSKNSHDLGLLLSNYNVSLGGFSPDGKLLSPSLYTTSDAATPVDITRLIRAFSINRFGGYVTMPNAQYNVGKTLAKGNILSNPKIRVKNREKARFNVGQRVPVQTTTTTGTIASTNVQYADVGIKLNAEPNIQLTKEVVVKLALEVSSVISKETSKTDGTTLLTIGTRNLDTVLSLKDGETVIIGGLIQNNSTDSKNSVFLLGDMPLLGPLISNNSETKEKSELLLAVTPRLVRSAPIQSQSQAIFDSGSEDEPALGQPYRAFILPSEYEGKDGATVDTQH